MLLEQTGSRFSWTPSTTYAQTFLCVSLGSAAEVDAAAAQVGSYRGDCDCDPKAPAPHPVDLQIAYVDPQFYDSSVPSSLASALPNMVSVRLLLPHACLHGMMTPYRRGTSS